MIRQFKKQSASFGKGGAFAIGAGGAAAGVFVAAKGAQIATPFAMPAITPLGKFVADFAEIGVRVLTRGAGSFSLLIAKETRNIVTSFPIFRAEKTLVNKLAEFVGGNAKFLGAALGVAAAAISLFMIYRDNKKAEENERNLKMARAGIMDEFEKISDAIGEKILNSVKQWAAQNINPLISKLDEEINAFEIQNSNEQIKNEKLISLLKRTENLIGEIQACQ